ncbi:hypothetical protein B0T21DRAFT_419020 [Apiosordaria backusii]|uniref:Uncharacterized protein n=1 Tax=Apiosordaria backusii TaxID=314023 RepID=A0AA40EYR4_9PEZI|nr:hypothetical protein B0T21DRAFT_419020 [Apiosordaria backusii]
MKPLSSGLNLFSFPITYNHHRYPPSEEEEEEEEDREASVYPVSSPSERQASPLEDKLRDPTPGLELKQAQSSFLPSLSLPPSYFQPPKTRPAPTMDSPEPYLRGGDPPERSPERRRHSSEGSRQRNDSTAGTKKPKRDHSAMLAAAQVLIESKYELPDSLRYKVGNLEQKTKPRLNSDYKVYFERDDTNPEVVAQRADKLAIQEPLVKVYGDPQRDPADAAKDGRVLDGVRSCFEEVFLGQVRVLPFGRDIKTELLGMAPGAWRPTQLGFNFPLPLDGKEIGNEWFGAVWQDLYLRVSHFAEEYFGEGLGFGEVEPNGGDITDEARIQAVWDGIGGKKNLIWFISQVARQDNMLEGGWDLLLAKAVRRKLVVTGVVAKILEREVFDELLFGADDLARDMLEGQDKALVQVEGYWRTRIRADSIKALMRGDELTPYFWEQVDKLSIQITTLLLPLLKLMDKNFNNSRAKSLQGFHQQIHNIVAQAGYLSLHMAWSKDIFRLSAPFLGQAWAVDQNQVDGRILLESKDAAVYREEQEKQKWLAEKERYRADPENYSAEPSLLDKAAELGFYGVLWAVLGFIPSLLYGKVATYDVFPTWDSKPDVKGKNWRSPPYLAKVQIIVWPKCERYGLMGEIDPELQTSRKGESISTLLQSQVVYYQGRTDNRGEAAEGVPTLPLWLDRKRSLLFNVWRDRLVKLLFAFLVFSALSYLVPFLWVIPKVCLALVKLVVLIVLDAVIQVLTLGIFATKVILFLLSALWHTLLSWVGFEFPGASYGQSEGWVWRSPSWAGKRFVYDGFHVGVGRTEFGIPAYEGETYTIPWFGWGSRGVKERKPDYLDEILGTDFERRQKELEAEKEKARERARERAKELERLQREKDLEDEEEIEITKVVEGIFPGPITPPPSSSKTRRMTLKKSWTRKGEEPGPEIWEEYTPGYFEILTEKAKELPVFKDTKEKAKEKFEEQKRLAERRKAKIKKELEENEGEKWKKYVKPDWVAWFGGPTEEELAEQEAERRAAEEAARRETETRKERKKREKEEARLKKLREAEAKEKKELEEIQRKERELELEMARRKAEPRAPVKVRPAFNKQVFSQWWDSTVGELGLEWKPVDWRISFYYPTVSTHKSGRRGGDEL